MNFRPGSPPGADEGGRGIRLRLTHNSGDDYTGPLRKTYRQVEEVEEVKKEGEKMVPGTIGVHLVDEAV
jgi:hypothetical protein